MSAPKKKIYFLLSSETYLEPISGDRINEMNIIRAMLGEYDVYYNGVLVKPEDRAFGDESRVINTPKDGEYDLIYIRNNKQVFLDSPSPKLWFASPYDKECFEQADGIVCMTKPWREALSKYNADMYDYFGGTYPRDMSPPASCILFPQVIDDSLFHRNEEDRSSNEKTGNISNVIKTLINNFVNKKEKKKVIRHFGPVRNSNYPYQIIGALKDKKIASVLRAECIGAGKKVSLPKEIINIPRIPQEQVLEKLRSASAIWYSQDALGHIGGSLKVLEAMAAGVPILLPRYDARVDELGEEYPFFWDLTPGTDISTESQDDFNKKLFKIINLSEQERKEISEYLIKRALRHSKNNVTKIINEELSKFWEQYNG